MQCRKIFFFIICVFSTASVSLAQQLPFVLYTPKDGLVNSRVRSAYQDSKGRMYLITYSGLSVYDGARFTNYTADEGLAVEMVNDVIQMGDDSLWIAVNTNKVNCLVRGKLSVLKTADNFYPVINRFLKSRTGELYALCDDGLFIFRQNRFIELPFINKQGVDVGANLTSAVETDGLLFIQTDWVLHVQRGALYVYDPRLKEIAAEKNNPFFYFAEISPNNEIWVCTDQGIKMVDKTILLKNKIFTLIPLPAQYNNLSNIITTYIFFDRQGTIWWKSKSTLFKTDTTGKSMPITSAYGLGSGNIHSIYQDREGTLWFCTEDVGVEKLVTTHIEYHQRFSGNDLISDVNADPSNGTVLLFDALQQQILVFYKNQLKTYPVKKTKFEVNAILPQQNGLWLAGAQHASWLQLNNKEVFTEKYLYSDTTSIVSILRPITDPYGNIIASGSNNITVLSNGRKIFSYPIDYLGDQLAIDSNKRLWVVTRLNKLLVFTINPEQPEKYLQLIKQFDKELPAINLRSLTIDKNNNVWIGTRFDGLFCLQFNDLRISSWKKITTRNGLTENFISYLYCDKDNSIWACTPSGLDNIQIKGNQFQINNITKSNNIYQYVGKVVEDKSGVKWALTTTGIIKIHPEPPLQPSPLPTLLITELRIGNESIRDLTNNMKFSFVQNDLGFHVAAPSFYDEKQIRYSYLLKGSNNNNWSKPSNIAAFNFINLQPGNYELQMKAIFPASRYPDQILNYSFTILPPWWETWWFKTLLVVLSVGLLILIIRSYFKSKLEKQRKALEKQQAIEKERTRIALDMHDDLGAGLSTIRFLSEKVRRSMLSDTTRADIEKMTNTSNELVENMNEIIWAMNEKNDTLEDLLFYTRSYAKEYCEENRLECLVHFPEDIPSVFVSGELRRNVFLTVKESLHNIVKHAGATRVEITITLDKDLIVAIQDNGRGFMPVYQENTSGGNGLKNMQKRIESLGGNFISMNGQGVTIQMRVPLEKL